MSDTAVAETINAVVDLFNTMRQAKRPDQQPASSSPASPPSTVTISADQVIGREFIKNGDFSSGNTGFTTDYVHAPGTNGLYPAATYAISANPTTCHGAFAGRDHTSGSGNFMIVNGAANRLVWRENVPIVPGLRYGLAAWVCSVYPENPATLIFSINGAELGRLTAPAAVNDWRQFRAEWDAGPATTADLRIMTGRAGDVGCDFGLDDISLVAIGVVASVPPPTGPADLQSEHQELLNLTNAERAKQGLQPLRLDSKLTAAAERHSTDMAKTGRLDHAGSDGTRGQQRIDQAGYDWQRWGENVSMGQGPFGTAASVVSRWMESPPHRKNILTPEFMDVGFGVAVAADGSRYFTQVFGALRGGASPGGGGVTTPPTPPIKPPTPPPVTPTADTRPARPPVSPPAPPTGRTPTLWRPAEELDVIFQ